MAGVMWRAAGAGDSRGPDGAQTGLQGAGAGVCGSVGVRAAMAVVTGIVGLGKRCISRRYLF